MKTTLLETDRLILRKPVLEDAEAIFSKYARDREVTKYVMWKPHKSIEETIAFVNLCIDNWDKGNHFTWCIVKKDDDELMGMIHLIVDNSKADFGYILMKSEWGRGFMPEALKKIVEFAFSNDKLYRVWGICDIDNIASAKVMEKSGLTREGILRKFSIHPNISDIPRDVYVYSIVR
jgi:[ribosomal protein S5]-alanine N-acetyltransferase